MKFDPQIHHCRSIRLKGYDYTLSGAYFITLNTWQKEPLFGTIIQGEMHLNYFGGIVQDVWNDLPKHYPHIQLDAFCIMPDHVHGIIVSMDVRQGGSESLGIKPEKIIPGTTTSPDTTKTRPYTPPSPPARSPYGLPEIVRAFKTYSARRINTLRHTPGLPALTRPNLRQLLPHTNCLPDHCLN